MVLMGGQKYSQGGAKSDPEGGKKNFGALRAPSLFCPPLANFPCPPLNYRKAEAERDKEGSKKERRKLIQR